MALRFGLMASLRVIRLLKRRMVYHERGVVIVNGPSIRPDGLTQGHSTLEEENGLP